MTFHSLFSGIGGIDLGLERSGMECLSQVEIDEFCLKVLEKHWPDVAKYKDIKEVKSLSYADVIAAGFPCQPVSYAGKHVAQKDPRWLWPEVVRVIRMVQPEYILLENVPGLLKWGMSEVLGDLAECRYAAEWQSIPASAFGYPHRRFRVFIIAYSASKRLEGERISEIFYSSLPWKSIQMPRISESAIVRKRNGVSSYMDRVRALGNAVIPEIAEWLGGLIQRHNNKKLRASA